MSRTFGKDPFTEQSPSGERQTSIDQNTSIGTAAGTALTFSAGKSNNQSLLDTTSSASISGVLADPVWGEPALATLWDDIGNDTFVFRESDAFTEDPLELQAGDRLDLGWGAPELGPTLTLLIGPTFTGAGQLIIHANGDQTYIESNPSSPDVITSGLSGSIFAGSDNGGGDC